jgi:hypothetical protein
VDPDERLARGAVLRALDQADEEGVVADAVLGADRALEPAERAFEQGASRTRPSLDPLPHRDRRHPPGEVLRQRDLVGAEQRDGEAARVAQQLVRGGRVGDRDADERRLERERDERGDREPEPLDTFGRNLYVDTMDSAYGKGWKRENSFLMHKGTGKFCYGFYSHGSRPAGAGTRYRATIIGPGVTPDIYWESEALGAYDKAFDLEMHEEQKAFYAGDSLCKAV